jgi:hypothetical protein
LINAGRVSGAALGFGGAQLGHRGEFASRDLITQTVGQRPGGRPIHEVCQVAAVA